MSKDEARTTVTFLMWLAFTVIMIGALVTHAFRVSGTLYLMCFAILVGTFVAATRMMWKYASNRIGSIEACEKSMSRNRVDQMLENMNEGDLDELRSRLLAVEHEWRA